MTRRIVLLSDGTGNAAAKAMKTNVWRMFQALDQTQADQLAYYDDGVGTSANKYLAALGGAFGWGLQRNVLQMYLFVCRNWTPGTEIFAFGFSRGAFTIRVLVDLITTVGLVSGETQAEWERNAAAAYRQYRYRGFPSRSPLVNGMRWLRSRALAVRDFSRAYPRWDALAQGIRDKGRHQVPIRFLGLWDTVEAYGVPIVELKKGISRVLWPMVFGDLRLSPQVQRACHALSLDDQRTTFHPLLWDESREPLASPSATTASRRITQVWFAGVHANVGGGYPEDRLSLVPLEWMMDEAMAAGLALTPRAVEDVRVAASPFARIYDSRAGLAAYYRYGPRRVDMGLTAAGEPAVPIVHWSVLLRMTEGADRYAPLNLPDRFDLWAPGGQLLRVPACNAAAVSAPPATAPARAGSSSAAPPFAAPSSTSSITLTSNIESTLDIVDISSSSNDIRALPSQHQTGASGPIPSLAPTVTAAPGASTAQAIRGRVDRALARLGQPDADGVELTWDTVFWRRANYLVTVLLTALLAAYPWLGQHVARLEQWWLSLNIFGSHTIGPRDLDHITRSTQSLVSPLLDSAGGLMPGYVMPWVQATRLYPIEVAALVGVLLLSLVIGSGLDRHLRDRAWAAWQPEPARSSFVLAQVAGHAGWLRLCRQLAVLALGLGALGVWWGWRQGLNRSLFVVGALLALYLLLDSLGARARLRACGTPQLPGPVGLRLARALRQSPWAGRLFGPLVGHVLPVLLALALLLGGLVGTHKLAYEVGSAWGALCTASSPQDQSRPPFDTAQACWSTGERVEAGRRYRLTVESADGDWFDRQYRADLGGLAQPGWVHWLALPLRRHWGADWFAPVVRIGQVGGAELPLRPGKPLADANYPASCGADAASGIGALEPLPTSAAEAAMACAPTPAERRAVSMEFVAPASGEVFLFVNDAMPMLPGASTLFYGNNRGTARVTLTLATPRGDP